MLRKLENWKYNQLLDHITIYEAHDLTPKLSFCLGEFMLSLYMLYMFCSRLNPLVYLQPIIINHFWLSKQSVEDEPTRWNIK